MNIKQTYTFLILACCLLFLPVVKSQDIITLEAVLKQVEEQSFAVKTAGYQMEIAQQANRFYRSQLKPTVGLWGSLPNYSKTSSPIVQPDGSVSFQSIRQANSTVSLYAEQVISQTGGTVFLNTGLQRFDNFDADFKQYNGIPVRLGIRQPLFGYNPWKYQKSIQPLLLQEAQKTFNTQLEAALGQASSYYFDILIAKQNLDIAKTNEKVNQNLLTITEERLRLGKVSLDEKLQLEIELNVAKLSVSQANNQVEQAIARLNIFLGSTVNTTSATYEEPSMMTETTINMADLFNSYRQNRPEIIAYQRSIHQSENDIAQAKDRYGFQANIQVSIGLAKGAETIEAIYQNPFDEQQFTLSLQIPILDWGKKDAAIQQIKLQQKNTVATYDQQLLELENNIRQMAAVFTRLQNDISLLKEIMDKADERFNISNERYILGNIDITNLTIAQREKDQAKRNYINALKSYWGSYFQLRLLTGFDIVNGGRG